MSLKIIILLLILGLTQINFLNTLDNGLARTPPMGWLTWQRFRCNIDCQDDPENCISEYLIKVMANRMVTDGYLEAGYEYIIIDDCWLAAQRDANGRLQPDPKRFPSGIRALADYVHDLGLKFGIYEDFGTLTCGGYPGSIDHLELDANTFAEWTVDYLKFDGCYSDPKQMDTGYPKMSYFLNNTQRPILFSCEWPLYQKDIGPNYTAIAQYCNQYRNYGDVDDDFDSINGIVEWYASQQDKLAPFHGPGHWNDPDMLVIGNFGLSYGQSQAQMALWSILAAPLIMSVDLRTIEPWFKEILQNKNMLAINQDKLGIMGKRFSTVSNVQLWSKQLSNNFTAFVFYNSQSSGTPTKLKISLKNLNLTSYAAYNLYETFSGFLIGKYTYSDTLNSTVNPSGSVFAFWAEPSTQWNKPKLFSSL